MSIKWFFLSLFLASPALAGSITIDNLGTGQITIDNRGAGFMTTGMGGAGATGCSPLPIFVSSASQYFAAATSTNITVANVQAGDYIFVGYISAQAAGSSVSMSDDATPTSTYTAHAAVVNSAGPTFVQVFTATSNATGSVKISISAPSSGDSGAHVAVFRNLSSTGFDIQASGTEAGAGATFNTGSFSTALQNNVVFIVYGNESTSVTNIAHTSTAGSPIKLGDQLGNTSSSAYFITSALQSSKTGTVSWTTSSSDGVLIYDVVKAGCLQ